MKLVVKGDTIKMIKRERRALERSTEKYSEKLVTVANQRGILLMCTDKRKKRVMEGCNNIISKDSTMQDQDVISTEGKH